MNEIELKFLVGADEARRIWAHARPLTEARPRTRRLHSIYYDTPERSLRDAGIAVRLRRDGRRWIQTVKADCDSHGGLRRVREDERPAPRGKLHLDAIEDATLRDAVLGQINGAALEAVSEAVMRRKAACVALGDGTRAELAVDVGEIRTADRAAPLSEVEIELIEGTASGLFAIALQLMPDGGVHFSRCSKADRGYRLADEGVAVRPVRPRRAARVQLDTNMTAEQAAQAVLRECLDQVAANMVAVRWLDDPEAAHQLRVGLRRLRTAFAAFRDILCGPETDALRGEARWLGREVGRLRDAEVVALDIVGREALAQPHEPALAALADMLRTQAEIMRGDVRAVLAGPRAQAFVLDAARYVETRGWLSERDMAQSVRLAQPAADAASAALKRQWKKARRGARGLETLSSEERHDLRKHLKGLRYTAEFFETLYGTHAVRPFLARLKRLQNLFGALNDAATTAEMLGPESLPDTPGLQRAAGWVVGAAQARMDAAWRKTQARWKDLKRADAFWR